MTDFYTPKGGHLVHVIVGNASDIVRRGEEIESLGQQMKGAAGVLREIAAGATEEHGRSIERIRDEVDGVYEELDLAGQRYEPTGTAMKQYGDTLSAVQAAMGPLVTDIESQIAQVQSKQAAYDAAQQALQDTNGYDPNDADEAAERREARSARTTANTELTLAQNSLDDLTDAFDAEWNTWNSAYNSALSSVTTATEGALTDHWTDNLAGIVEVVVEIISYVGIVVAIAALIIGGPLIALIGAVLAVIALIGTVFLFMKGRLGGGELGWAIVGVLPFGRLGAVFRAGSRAQSLKFLAGPVFEISESAGQLRALRGVRSTMRNLDSGHGLGRVAREGLSSRVTSTFADIRWQDIRTIPSNVVHNATRGGGAWSRNMANEFAGYTRHHQSVIGRVAPGSDRVIQHGTETLTMGEMVVNFGDFTFSNGMVVGDVVDIGAEAAQGGTVDSWREQLATSDT